MSVYIHTIRRRRSMSSWYVYVCVSLCVPVYVMTLFGVLTCWPGIFTLSISTVAVIHTRHKYQHQQQHQ